MNASDQALSIYQRALGRLDNNKASLQDEVLVALWEETEAQAKMIREQALKISMLEMRQDMADVTMCKPEKFLAMMDRICSKPSAAKTDTTH